MLFLVSAPAEAAVTVYPVGIFSQNGVTNAGNALGAPNGAGAVISNGGRIVFQYSQWLSGNSVTLNMLPNGFVATGAISIGHVVGGVAVFSAQTGFTPFFGLNQTFDLSTQCAAISASGCSLIRVRTTGTFFSSGISLNAIASSAPEPSAWALMIVGFAAMGWRLKQLRRANLAGRGVVGIGLGHIPLTA